MDGETPAFPIKRPKPAPPLMPGDSPFKLAFREFGVFDDGMKTLFLLMVAALLASCATRGGCCGEGSAGRETGAALSKTR